jgi:hypothetical protein
MRRLISALGRAIGIHFAPDNHVIPVLRLERFNRVKGPGYFWIIPIVERTLPPINTGIRVTNFIFEEVLSHDNIPFRFHLTVLFSFDPALPSKKVTTQLIRASDGVLQSIVQDFTNQGLRRLASRFDAQELCGEAAISTIERDLIHYLRSELRILGLVPLRSGGVLIKETVAPDRFKHTMLNVKRHEATLHVLGSYREISLMDRAILAEFLTGLADREGNLTLLSPLDAMYLPHALDQKIPRRNGR